MSYNINFEQLRNIYEKATAGTSKWQGLFTNIRGSFEGLINDEGFTGNAAQAVKDYLGSVHVFTIAAIETIIAEFNSRLILYCDGLYQYESDYYAKLNEDCLTVLIGRFDDMITYAGEAGDRAHALLNDVAGMVPEYTLEAEYIYTAPMAEEREKLRALRDNVAEHDAEFSGVQLQNLRELTKEAYELVQKIHAAGTINVNAVDYSYFFTPEKIQDMVEHMYVSLQYASEHEAAVRESAEHLQDIRLEIQEEAEREARKHRIEKGIVLIGEAVIGVITVVATAGTDAPLVISVITTTAGSLMVADGAAKAIEGGQEIYYGLTGDIETPSFNFMRDTFFEGDQERYDISMMVVTSCFGFSQSLNNILTAGAFGTAESITAAEVELIKAVGGVGVDACSSYITEHYDFGILGNFVVSTTINMAGGMLIDGASDVIETELYQHNSTRYETTNTREFHLSAADSNEHMEMGGGNAPDSLDVDIGNEHVYTDMDAADATASMYEDIFDRQREEPPYYDEEFLRTHGTDENGYHIPDVNDTKLGSSVDFSKLSNEHVAVTAPVQSGDVGAIGGAGMQTVAGVGEVVKGTSFDSDNFSGTYDGVKQASEYLKQQGVPRQYRKQILESFDVRTIKLQTADDNTYGLRFYGGNANAEGRYLFETFSPLTNRNNLALPYEWNSMTGIQQFQVKMDTKMITGATAPQTKFGSQYLGGAHQWYINNLEDLIKCQ